MSFIFDLVLMNVKITFSSMIWLQASQLGLTRRPVRDGDPVMLYLSDYLSKAKEICSLNLAELSKMKAAPGPFSERTDDVTLTCFDLTYIHELLRVGYQRSNDEVLYTGSQIEMNNHP